MLGADTVVVVDGRILGKPRDDADARRMLRLLSGREHTEVADRGVALRPRIRIGSGSAKGPEAADRRRD